MAELSPTCETCTFWRRGAAPRRTESPEHRTWRPCGNRAPSLRCTGGVELPTRGNVILTAPGASCNGYHRRMEAAHG